MKVEAKAVAQSQSTTKDSKNLLSKEVTKSTQSKPNSSLSTNRPIKPPPAIEDPPYVVTVTARKPTEEEKVEQTKTYTPRELRSKAKSFLESGSLPPEQREVLKEILNKQEAEENAALKKRIRK